MRPNECVVITFEKIEELIEVDGIDLAWAEVDNARGIILLHVVNKNIKPLQSGEIAPKVVLEVFP